VENALNEFLEKMRHRLKIDPRLADLQFREEQGELHLSRGDKAFARLIPAEKEGIWRMEYFRNLERWETLDFKGSLEECLDFLAEKSHYLFWEG
jgi:hypothetical protein